MDLPEDDLDDEDFTIDLDELWQLSEVPGEEGPPLEKRLTRAAWRPQTLPPDTRKHGSSAKHKIRKPKPKSRPTGIAVVQQRR